MLDYYSSPCTHDALFWARFSFAEVILYGRWSSQGVRFVRCRGVRDYPYLEGKNV